MPTVESKFVFLAPHLSAMAMPCMISGESGPTMCTPTTCALGLWHLSKEGFHFVGDDI